MIKHVVVFKLKDKKDELENFVQALKDLPRKIGLVKSYEVGVDSLKSPYSFDIVLISTYNSMEDLFKYKEHDAHSEILVKLAVKSIRL